MLLFGVLQGEYIERKPVYFYPPEGTRVYHPPPYQKADRCQQCGRAFIASKGYEPIVAMCCSKSCSLKHRSLKDADAPPSSTPRRRAATVNLNPNLRVSDGENHDGEVDRSGSTGDGQEGNAA